MARGDSVKRQEGLGGTGQEKDLALINRTRGGLEKRGIQSCDKLTSAYHIRKGGTRRKDSSCRRRVTERTNKRFELGLKRKTGRGVVENGRGTESGGIRGSVRGDRKTAQVTQERKARCKVNRQV